MSDTVIYTRNIKLVKNHLKIVFFLILLLIWGVPGLAEDRIAVFVSIAPQKWLVQQIGKDLVDVHVMVPPGASPHTYEPKPRQMIDISKAKLYFGVGVAFEKKWLKKIAGANPRLRIIHTDHGIKKRQMTAGHHDGEGGHDNHHHEPTSPDPHIWLSPPLVKIQAQSITEALIRYDEIHRSDFEANFRQLATDIDKLDNQLKDTFSGHKGFQFLVFHPSWGYFAENYGLRQVPIEIEGKDPKPAQLVAVIEHARKENIKVVFVQPQFSRKSADLIAREIGGRVAFADPLAEDWIDNLQSVARQFKAALK